MSTMTDDQLDQLGRLADTADNLVGASRLALRPQMHIEQLRIGLERMSAELKALYVAISGENPWSEGDEERNLSQNRPSMIE